MGPFALILASLASLHVKVDLVLYTLLTTQGKTIMADLTALTSQVTATTTVEQSAITLIQGIASQLSQAGTDPVKLSALQSQLSTSAAALAAAVTANTPAAP
jgi:hypothetical protein